MDGGVEKERGFSWFSSTPQSHFVCQLSLLRRATPVGTRPPYSLPFVILPVPARSPFRLLVHRTRSTPNLKEGAFWCGTNSNIKPALKGEVDASATSRRRGCIGAALIYGNPSVNPPCGVLPAPRPGSLLGALYKLLHYACPERGGGCECNEQTEGLHRGYSYLRQPLSQSALRRIASSPAGTTE